MQPRGALFLSLMVTNFSGEKSFTRFKRIKGPQCSWRGCPHSAFGALKATNLGKQIVMNS